MPSVEFGARIFAEEMVEIEGDLIARLTAEEAVQVAGGTGALYKLCRNRDSGYSPFGFSHSPVRLGELMNGTELFSQVRPRDDRMMYGPRYFWLRGKPGKVTETLRSLRSGEDGPYLFEKLVILFDQRSWA